jgi:hypothetical protein
MATPNPAHLNDMLQSILDVACNCLDDTPLGRPADCFISHGQPPDDCCDFLSVWAEYIRPIQGFENAQYVSGVKFTGRCCDIGAVMDIAIRLVRPCYPTLKDNATNPFPPPIEIQAAAENLLIDGWAMRCCVMRAYCEDSLFPDDTECLEVAWGDMVPHGPRGGCAGWTWRITVELEQCC